MKKDLIISILSVGICTMAFVIGLYIVLLSKEKWESMVGKLVSVRDLEVSLGNFIFLKLVGAGLLLLSFFLVYYFFIAKFLEAAS